MGGNKPCQAFTKVNLLYFLLFPPIADLEGVGEGRKQAVLGSGDLKELNMKLICSVSQIIFN